MAECATHRVRLNSVSKDESDLLRAAEGGDTNTVKNLLEQRTGINFNCADIMGRTPIRIAAGNEHLEIVQLLLDVSEKSAVYDALMFAIKSDHEEITTAILNHSKYYEIHQDREHGGPPLRGERCNFADVTPLILAAECNRFHTVMLLLQMGETIEAPHSQRCHCDSCTQQAATDDLRLAKSRLCAFRGLASEAYISLASEDPMLTAFQLVRKLKRSAQREKYFQDEYLELADKVSDYLVELIGHVQGDAELDVLLNATDGAAVDLRCYGKLARLKVAICYEVKKFIAHPACQKKLDTIIYGPLHELGHLPTVLFYLSFVAATLLCPLLLFSYWFVPKSKLGQIMRTPVMKMLVHTISHITFMLLIIFYSFGERDIMLQQPRLSEYPDIVGTMFLYGIHINLTANPRADFVLRSHTLNSLLLVLYIFVLGMMWQECKQVYKEGIKGYITSYYNWMDFIMIALYLASAVLRGFSLIKVRKALDFFGEPSTYGNASFQSNLTVLEHFYWMNADRKTWDELDPQTICDGLFSAANVLSMLRLTYILAIDASLGPLQLSLGLMMADVIKFTFIFSIFIVAFFVGMHNLYWYYNPDILAYVELNNINGIINHSSPAMEAFGTSYDTFVTIFWALFGMVDSSVTSLEGRENTFTELIGNLMFGAYNWITVIILLNMLIAMMSRSFEEISNSREVQWKFARTRLFMDYTKDFSTLPVPLNLIPSPKAILRCLWRMCRALCVRRRTVSLDDDVPEVQAPRGCCECCGCACWHDLMDHRLHTPYNRAQYKEVIHMVVQRFIENKMSQPSLVLNEEIKQDLSAFRYEVLNKMNRLGNQESTPKLERRQKAMDGTLQRIQGSMQDMASQMRAISAALQTKILVNTGTSTDSDYFREGEVNTLISRGKNQTDDVTQAVSIVRLEAEAYSVKQELTQPENSATATLQLPPNTLQRTNSSRRRGKYARGHAPCVPSPSHEYLTKL